MDPLISSEGTVSGSETRQNKSDDAMTFQLHTIALSGDTPGATTQLNYYTAGPVDAEAKVYLQAALHADEQPGTMLLHHLLPMLRAADAEGRLNARFVVLPMVNPLGMANLSFRHHSGRYDPNTGVNFNRRWPDLAAAIADSIASKLTDDEESNGRLIRQAVAAWINAQTPTTVAQRLRLLALNLCHDADYMLDLHCDDDSLPHIFISPEFMPDMQDLADWLGSRATLTAEDSGGGSFDEVLPVLYRKLRAANPGKPIAFPKVTATLEYRGQADVFDAVGKEDALRLFGFFIGRGLVNAHAGVRPEPMPAATPFSGTEIVRVSEPGLLAYRVELGDKVAKGQPIADLIALDGPEAFLKRTPVVATIDGFVLSRSSIKYVTRGASIAKIIGTDPIASRGGYLLED
jgi:predicted deacylase